MKLKDYFGRWFKPEPKPDTRELAAVSLPDRWSSYPSVGLTPGGLAGIFQEADQGVVRRQMELFEEMEEKDAHLAALLQSRKLSVLSLDYEVLPYANTPEDEQHRRGGGGNCLCHPQSGERFSRFAGRHRQRFRPDGDHLGG
jgi:phage gp29-like protein